MQTWIEGRVLEKIRWNDGLFSLRVEAAVAPFEAGQFIKVALDIDGERVGRAYSYVNPPQDPVLEIHFNTVPAGPLTPELAQMEVGSTLWVTAEPNGVLTPSQLPGRPHLWMLSTGTAIGPFLSILQTPETFRRFQRVVLVHGVRHCGDLSYRALAERLVADHPGRLDYVPFVSREPCDGALPGRIPPAITDGRLEARVGLRITPEESNIMVCGNAAMIGDALAVLEAKGLKRHRRRDPGNVATEKYY